MKNEGLYFTKLTNIAIVATFFALWIAVFFNETVENALAYISILTFGMLHGANDLKLLQKSNRVANGKNHFWRNLSLYVTTVVGGLVLFLFFPAFAFLLFIAVSAYHFGEQHWLSKLSENSVLAKCFYSFYGLFILCLLFYVHHETVAVVVEKITGAATNSVFYNTVLLLSGIAFGGCYLLLYLKKKLKANLLKQVFFLLVFYIVFNTASLLWSFAIYFILWHSLPSIVDQIVFLYGTFSSKSLRRYVKDSFVYWFLAALGSGLLLFFLKDDLETSLSLFLAFLAAITFPHVFVISRLHHHGHEEP